MLQTLKDSVGKFHRTFHKSGVIVFARLQVLIGALWAVLTATDLAPLIGNPKYVTAWLLFSGLVTEVTRRSGTEVNEDNHLVPRSSPVVVTPPVPTVGDPEPASPLGPSSDDTK